jgi:hypothetical protein
MKEGAQTVQTKEAVKSGHGYVTPREAEEISRALKEGQMDLRHPLVGKLLGGI